MKRLSLIVAVLVVASMARAERTLSLSEAVSLALQNNLTAKLAQATSDEARARAALAAADLLPTILGTVSESRVFKVNLAAEGFPSGSGLPFSTLIGPFNVFDARLAMTQKLFDFGIYKRLKAARALSQLADWQGKLAGDQVRSAAALAYIEAQRAAQAVQAATADVELASNLFNQVQDQHRAGTATGVDVARSQTRLVQEQVRLIRAKADARQAELRLDRVTGLSMTEPLRLTDALQAVNVDTPTLTADTVPAAWSQRLELRVAKAEAVAEGAALAAAEAGYAPSITANGNYGYSGNLPADSERTGSIGGQLNIPIFSGGSTAAAVHEARAQKAAADAQWVDVSAQVEEDVHVSHENLNAAAEELTSTALEVQLAQKELTLARDRFAAGVGDNIQLLSAQTALETARESQVNALASYHIARVNWALALGTVSAFKL